MTKGRFLLQCSDHLSHSKNFTSLFPLIFLSKHISLYALGRIRWILDIIWPLNQYLKLKNQRNWLKQVWMFKFWSVINRFFMHWTKKLTLAWKLQKFSVKTQVDNNKIFRYVTPLWYSTILLRFAVEWCLNMTREAIGRRLGFSQPVSQLNLKIVIAFSPLHRHKYYKA